MERDIKAVILMLSSQAMINLGLIPDPVTKTSTVELEKATVFIELLNVLKKKTKNNLSKEEDKYLNDVYKNLLSVYNDKLKEKVGS